MTCYLKPCLSQISYFIEPGYLQSPAILKPVYLNPLLSWILAIWISPLYPFPMENVVQYLWPYLGKPGLTKLALNHFGISTHFQTLRMHWRSFSRPFKMLAMFPNETEMLWKPFPNHCRTFADCVVKHWQCISMKQPCIEKHSYSLILSA